MQPVQINYPPILVIKLLQMSGMLRDLGEHNHMDAVAPDIKVKIPADALDLLKPGAIDKDVKAWRLKIYSDNKDGDVRLNARLSKAFEILEELKKMVADPGIAAFLTTKRQYCFNEILPGGYKDCTPEEMLTELTKPDWFGNAPCMHLLGGQLQEYALSLCSVPLRRIVLEK